MSGGSCLGVKVGLGGCVGELVELIGCRESTRVSLVARRVDAVSNGGERRLNETVGGIGKGFVNGRLKLRVIRFKESREVRARVSMKSVILVDARSPLGDSLAKAIARGNSGFVGITFSGEVPE